MMHVENGVVMSDSKYDAWKAAQSAQAEFDADPAMVELRDIIATAVCSGRGRLDSDEREWVDGDMSEALTAVLAWLKAHTVRRT